MWKTASVIPILKPGKDPTLPDSFRPISLLPVLSKITEKTIQKRLCQHLNDNDILIPQQHGFRAGLSTSHQLLRVVEYVKTGFRDRKSTGAVFLDIQKAFDRGNLIANYEWVRDTFQNTPEGISTAEEEIFIDFTSSGKIKRQFCNKSLFEFWAEVDDEFSTLKQKHLVYYYHFQPSAFVKPDFLLWLL
ncbi:probable RNA-directed DNA polymerase from transposon X-element [Trichonephila clavipes]|nr:probable RNA-directed DNA polymerase from transposon X-element [Trichonephila clavipes]